MLLIRGSFHHQFYLKDKGSSHDTGEMNFWTEDAIRSRLAIGDGVLGVGIECYGPVRGELVLLDKRRDQICYSQYDHIVQAGIKVKSGVLQVLDCPNSTIELELKVGPGEYGVRIYSLNLDTVIGDTGEDTYRIEIWQDTDIQRTLLKQYSNSDR